MNINKKKSAIIIFLSLIIVFRLYLPTLLKNYVNKTLSQLDGFGGRVEEVRIDLYRGAYTLIDFHIFKIVNEEFNQRKNLNIFIAKDIDISLEWRAIFKGRIVAEIFITNFSILIDFTTLLDETDQKQEIEVKQYKNAGWQNAFRALVPIQLNVLDLDNGNANLVLEKQRKVIYELDKIKSKITNIRNIFQPEGLNPSDIFFESRVLQSGTLSLNGTANFVTEKETYDLKVKLEKLELAKLNYISKKFIGLDFHGGYASLFTEFKLTPDRLEGYFKPLFIDADIFNAKEDLKDLSGIWDAIASFFSEILENQKKDQLALIIPFNGAREEFNFDNFSSFISLLKNAYIEALKADLIEEKTEK